VPTPAHIRSTFATIASPPEELRAVATYHKALADPTRLRLLAAPRRAARNGHRADRPRRPVTAARFVASAPSSRAGVVETRRSGREVICTLSREALDYFRARERDLLGLTA
jgi:hypothetical protein